MFNKRAKGRSAKENPSISRAPRRKTRLWQMILLPVLSIIIFFLLLEAGFTLLGVKPITQSDPFVGFSSGSPLFVGSRDSAGVERLTTARNKKDYFNQQSFQRHKGTNTFRIFTLGGSTTYGRPYDDATSFSGWLRELLPAVDKAKQWEVINAGGISYASYRVTRLMKELVEYEPDLFIVYTGHNEFLEERTYHELRQLPPFVRTTAAVLAKTRTWSAMTSALQSLKQEPTQKKEGVYQLSAEVDAILDGSVGLDAYHRDDALKDNVIKHFQISLNSMVSIARQAGAQIIFVRPASNLKDCTPFKSQDSPNISPAAVQQAHKFMLMSRPLVWEKQWPMALQFIDQAIHLNPELAELHFSRGQVLFNLGRFNEAKSEFIKARDMDICPLRAVTQIENVVWAVAKEKQVPLVDFERLLEQRMLKTEKHSIVGEEFFLDHVHPTIEGHKILAVALLDAMAAQGLTSPSVDWQRKVLPIVSGKIEGNVNPVRQGQALANLARVLLWAGKNEDAARLAKQAIDLSSGAREVVDNAVTSLATAYARNGRTQAAILELYKYLEKIPSSMEIRLKLGQALLDLKRYEEAAANLLLVSHLMPYYDWGHALLGISMADRGRLRIAYASLNEALRINPNNVSARQRLDRIRGQLDGQSPEVNSFIVQMTRYPSAAPHRLVQGRADSNGQFVADGIEVEFYENGRLKHFLDVESGRPKGLDITWDANGKQLSRQVVN